MYSVALGGFVSMMIGWVWCGVYWGCMRFVYFSSLRFRGGDGGGGFTLIEVLISIIIVVIIVGMVFINYGTFTSRSLLRVRSAELGEYVRFGQEWSGAAENFSKSAVLPSLGFQVVRVKVRKGMLKNFRLEKAPGAFTGFVEGSNFALARDSVVQGSRQVVLEPSERYFIDVCFIDVDASPQYVRKKLVLESDAACATDSMLCSMPNPAAEGYDAVQTARNNFDLHLSIEQPSREVYANLVPVSVSRGVETYKYASVEPNGVRKRVSDTYEGVRVVFITEKGYMRSVDVFQTGLVGFKAGDSVVGCG